MTSTDFMTAFAEFATTDTSIIAKYDAAIAKSLPFFNVAEWDDLLAVGQGNWVAHELTMRGLGATGGLKTAGAGTLKQVGRVMIQNSQTSIGVQMADPYQRTIYGQTYAALARMVGVMAAPLAI